MRRLQPFFLLLIVLFLLFPGRRIHAQTPSDSSRKNLKAIALPLFFYTPDTRWGFGASGLFTFNIGSDTSSTRRSSIMPGFAYTTMKQLLIWMPYQFFLDEQNYWVTGELDYFRYVYRYFGIGNEVEPGYVETYDAHVKRLRLNVMRRLNRYVYLGPSYGLDIQRNFLRDSLGLLNTERPDGALGGVQSSVGLALNIDSRDHINFPTRGWLIKSELKADHRLVGSSFECLRVSVNASHYLAFGASHVLAFNGGFSGIWGRPAYIQMSYLGGPERLRGYYEGQYRDHHAAWAQAEYRSPLLWRLGAVAFAGAGTVWGRGREWNSSFIRPNLGAGLRFRLDKSQKVNLRFDYGIGYRASGFYLTFSEAF